jgi:hypothetical protein
MQALKQDPDLEEDEAFLRRLIFPEEDRHLFTTPWRAGFRWFRSSNIIDLEKVRQIKSREGDGKLDTA